MSISRDILIPHSLSSLFIPIQGNANGSLLLSILGKYKINILGKSGVMISKVRLVFMQNAEPEVDHP